MSQRSSSKESDEGLSGTPRRSTRIAATIPGRRPSEDSTPAKITKTRRSSAHESDKTDEKTSETLSLQKRVLTRRMSRSPTNAPIQEESQGTPLRRSTRRASSSSNIAEDVQNERSESPVLTRRTSTRSRSISPTSEPSQRDKSKRAASTSPTRDSNKSTGKLKGRRTSITERITPLESIEETEKIDDKESENKKETLQPIIESEDSPEEVSKSPNKVVVRENLVIRQKDGKENDNTAEIIDCNTQEEQDVHSKADISENGDSKTTTQQIRNSPIKTTPEKHLGIQRKSPRLSKSSFEKPQDSNESIEVNLNLSQFENTRDTLNKSGASDSSDKENIRMQKELIVVAENLNLQKELERLHKSESPNENLQKSRKSTSFCEPMDVDETFDLDISKNLSFISNSDKRKTLSPLVTSFNVTESNANNESLSVGGEIDKSKRRSHGLSRSEEKAGTPKQRAKQMSMCESSSKKGILHDKHTESFEKLNTSETNNTPKKQYGEDVSKNSTLKEDQNVMTKQNELNKSRNSSDSEADATQRKKSDSCKEDVNSSPRKCNSLNLSEADILECSTDINEEIEKSFSQKQKQKTKKSPKNHIFLKEESDSEDGAVVIIDQSSSDIEFVSTKNEKVSTENEEIGIRSNQSLNNSNTSIKTLQKETPKQKTSKKPEKELKETNKQLFNKSFQKEMLKHKTPKEVEMENESQEKELISLNIERSLNKTKTPQKETPKQKTPKEVEAENESEEEVLNSSEIERSLNKPETPTKTKTRQKGTPKQKTSKEVEVESEPEEEEINSLNIERSLNNIKTSIKAKTPEKGTPKQKAQKGGEAESESEEEEISSSNIERSLTKTKTPQKETPKQKSPKEVEAESESEEEETNSLHIERSLNKAETPTQTKALQKGKPTQKTRKEVEAESESEEEEISSSNIERSLTKTKTPQKETPKQKFPKEVEAESESEEEETNSLHIERLLNKAETPTQTKALQKEKPTQKTRKEVEAESESEEEKINSSNIERSLNKTKTRKEVETESESEEEEIGSLNIEQSMNKTNTPRKTKTPQQGTPKEKIPNEKVKGERDSEEEEVKTKTPQKETPRQKPPKQNVDSECKLKEKQANNKSKISTKVKYSDKETLKEDVKSESESQKEKIINLTNTTPYKKTPKKETPKEKRQSEKAEKTNKLENGSQSFDKKSESFDYSSKSDTYSQSSDENDEFSENESCDSLRIKVDSLITNSAKKHESSDLSEVESVMDFIDDMAEEEEADTLSDDSNEIVDEGESVGSRDTEENDSDDSYEKNSFVTDEEGYELLSGDEYDLDQDDHMKTKKRSRILSVSESEEEFLQKPTQVNGVKEVNGVDVDSDIDKMSTQPYCGLSPPSIISLGDSLSEMDKNEVKEAANSFINKEDNLNSLEALKEMAVAPKSNDSAKSTGFTPNNSILEDENQRKRKRVASLTIQENANIDVLKDGGVSEQISKLVEAFCDTYKNENPSSNNVSLYISLEIAQPSSDVEEGIAVKKRRFNSSEIPSANEKPVCNQFNIKDELNIGEIEVHEEQQKSRKKRKKSPKKTTQILLYTELENEENITAEKPNKLKKKKLLLVENKSEFKEKIKENETKVLTSTPLQNNTSTQATVEIEEVAEGTKISPKEKKKLKKKLKPKFKLEIETSSKPTLEIEEEIIENIDAIQEEIKKKPESEVETIAKSALEIEKFNVLQEKKNKSKKKRRKQKFSTLANAEKTEQKNDENIQKDAISSTKGETLQKRELEESFLSVDLDKKIFEKYSSNTETSDYDILLPVEETKVENCPKKSRKRRRNILQEEQIVVSSKKSKRLTDLSQEAPTKKAKKLRPSKPEKDTTLKQPIESSFDYFPSKILEPRDKQYKNKKTDKVKKTKILPSVASTDGWDIEVVDTPLKPFSKRQFHIKDFKNRMLYDQSRVRRINSKKLLKLGQN